MPLDPALLADLHADLLAEAGRRAPAALAAWPTLGARGVDVPAPLAARWHPHRDGLAAWLRAALAKASGSGGWPEDPAGDLSGRVLAALQAHNQFLPLGPDVASALRGLTERALLDAVVALEGSPDAAALAAALGRAATAWAAGLAALAARLLADAAAAGVAPREVVSATYSPAVQLRVLGLDAAALAEPVLDLGCGRDAALVRHLRALGKDARGIDRVAAPADGVTRGDWLDVPLAPGSLGTVISHLGFSLHFLHHHLRPAGDPARHARRYMEILRALRAGGVFAYAPGLPFVETHLAPDLWRVERGDVPGTPDSRSGGVPPSWYAARVTRLR